LETNNQGDKLMSETLTKIIVDCSTGVVAEVPLTGEELAQREADAVTAAAEQAAREAAEAEALAAKESAQSKLTALGLTAEEIAALSK
jgi:hypothetical protein